MKSVQKVSAKAVLGYMVMPGLLPRLRSLFQSGFSWLAYTMAIVYYSVRLLPAGHPYIDPANMGRYGLRHVIAEAANRLVLRKENFDQIIVFFALLAGFVLLILQFVLLISAFLIRPALAAVAPVGGGAIPFLGMFATPVPTTDIAFSLLDKVFAIPGMFGSQYDPAVLGGIPPFNEGLQAMFQFYSFAMLIVASLIFLYYVLIVVGETAQTGTPFGRRFSHIWAPIRLVMALGLLVPLNYGMNSAQYITLYAAKWGSGFATNAWIGFNSSLTNALGTADSSLLARPKAPDIAGIVQFMAVARACKTAYEKTREPPEPVAGGAAAPAPAPFVIKPYLVKSGTGPGTWQEITPGPSPSWMDALLFYNYSDIVIVFGVQDENQFRDQKGYVFPFCGEITVATNDVAQLGAQYLQEQYYKLIIQLWDYPEIVNMGDRAAATFLESYNKPGTMEKVKPESIMIGSCEPTPTERLPPDLCKQQIVSNIETLFKQAILDARDAMTAGTDFRIPAELLGRGWAGAAIWYNRLAQWNGALFAAAMNIPNPTRMPDVMEQVQEQRRSSDQNIDAAHRYRPYLSDGSPVKISDKEARIATLLNAVYEYWVSTDTLTESNKKLSGNVIIDMINRVFGTSGLFDLQKNNDIHPLAQLVGIGKSMVESSIRNLLVSLAFSGLGGAATEMIGKHAGASLGAISGVFSAFTTIGLTIGFILFYILPFMPFMYFFFAVSGWIKAIFEAMVGVPLWALAHMRIDGHGLPGESASNGYFLIFEIFLRPILIVFGLVGSLVIFSAMVNTLHNIFPLVTTNLTGFDRVPTPRGVSLPGAEFARHDVDAFFFTIIYAVLVYIMATTSFKMIDMIPSSILRWLGAGVKTFNDDRGEQAVGQLTSYAAVGGAQLTGQAAGIMGEGVNLLGRTAGMPLGKLARMIDESSAANRIGGENAQRTVSELARRGGAERGRGGRAAPEAEE